MPIPYLGSKRESARRIVNLIKTFCPSANQFYDVFCGGLAISEAAQRAGFEVFASDLDGDIVALANEIMYGQCLDPKTSENIFNHPRFISREEFNATTRQSKSAKETGDWWSGYLRTVWSFGNNGRGYLYAKNIETTKRSLHALAVDGRLAPGLRLPLSMQEKIAGLDGWKKRRMAIRKTLVGLKRIQNLERLEILENLERLGHPAIRCSYDGVTPPAGAIIYCDPPYRGTAEYAVNKDGFDYKKFYDWCRQKAKTNPVFISEYQMPKDFKLIYEFKRRQTMEVHSTKKRQTKEYFI